MEKYDRKWPGSKNVFDFLGSGVCVKEIEEAVARTNSGKEAQEYNNEVERYKRKEGVLQYKFIDMFEEGVRDRVKSKREMYVVRYCTNNILYNFIR